MSNNPPNSNSSAISPNKLASLLAAARARNKLAGNSAVSSVQPANSANLSSPVNDITTGRGRDGSTITYNSKQLEFINTGSNGEPCVLLGAAGTGKTTCQQGMIERLIQSGRAGILSNDGHKYLPSGTPGIVVIAFTRRAVNNIRRFMPEDMKANCITHHKLLEYEPVYYEVLDPITGKEKTTMRFEPTRNILRTLPHSIHTVIIEEGSMYSKELFKELTDACPHKPQYIFLGDIQQLPPVFGSAILGYKMLEHKTVELTEVYRQALESPIIRLAHRILSGKGIPAKEYPEWRTEGKLTIHPWKKKLAPETALATVAMFFKAAVDSGAYQPGEDMILLPFNKSVGTDELNKHIANHIARKNSRDTYEIIAGFEKLYLSVGDKVLYDKEDAEIIAIKPNHAFMGAKYQPHSPTLDYWGTDQGVPPPANGETTDEIDNIDFILSQAATGTGEDRVRVASHVVSIRMSDSEKELHLDAAGDLNSMILGYALTVHKSQGSEWRKVFLVFHQSHATMLQRELLYTAVTRAKEELYIICEPETFTNGIRSQRIKGDTLAEKAIYFQGRIEEDKFKLR